MKHSIFIEIENTSSQESGLYPSRSFQSSSSVEGRLNQFILMKTKLVRATEGNLQPPVEAAPLTAILLASVCFTAVFGVVVLTVSALFKGKDQGSKVRTDAPLDIPCQNCRFFNKSQRLCCAVHPSIVLTEQALNCPDYRPQ